MALFVLIVNEEGQVVALEKRPTLIPDDGPGIIYKAFNFARGVIDGNPINIAGYPVLMNRGIAGITNSTALTPEQKAEYLALLATARPTDGFDAQFRPTVTGAGNQPASDQGAVPGTYPTVTYFVDP